MGIDRRTRTRDLPKARQHDCDEYAGAELIAGGKESIDTPRTGRREGAVRRVATVDGRGSQRALAQWRRPFGRHETDVTQHALAALRTTALSG